ncbi:unnamed protein product [Notodromas monacha]|nr:unnamed protein product [Notodromas monacha]CAG0925912.1 unnamed protein product [Notodromas monacha]
MYFAPVDATADQFAVKVLEESLPPVLSEGEKSCSVFRAGEPWQGVEEVNGVTLDINIGVRLVRYGAVRLVGEANEIRLHYNVGNTRVYREAGTKFVVIADEEVDVVEALISQYPQYSLIKDLPDIGGKSGKTLAFVTKLFEIGLLLTDAPVLAMRDVE